MEHRLAGPLSSTSTIRNPTKLNIRLWVEVADKVGVEERTESTVLKMEEQRLGDVLEQGRQYQPYPPLVQVSQLQTEDQNIPTLFATGTTAIARRTAIAGAKGTTAQRQTMEAVEEES